MAAGYKVEFNLEDWMLDGLESGKYIIRSGNLLDAQSHQVVKWLDVAHILPSEEAEGMIGSAINLAKSAGSAASVNLLMSAVNLAIGVAIYHKLGVMENKIDRCIGQLQQLSVRVNDIHEELSRQTLYPILQGFDLFDRARVSSNREHLLQSAQVELVKGMALARYWLQTRSRSELLEQLDLVRDISIALVKAAIAEAQIVRALEKIPTEAEIVYPFEKAFGIISDLEGKLKPDKPPLPGSSREIQAIKCLPNLFECNETLKIAANESLNLQLAITQGKTNIIEFDPKANKVKCHVHPVRRDLLPPAI